MRLTARDRVGFLLADVFTFAVAMNRRFRDSDSGFGQLAALLVGGLVLALTRMQRARRAWRSLWWRVAGVLNVRWRCELCQERDSPRVNRAFCRRCADAGLGYE